MFDNTLHRLSSTLFGDFNVNLLDMTSYRASKILNVAESLGLNQLISETIRVILKSMSLLDIIFTNS